jgi:hypothetical protein
VTLRAASSPTNHLPSVGRASYKRHGYEYRTPESGFADRVRGTGLRAAFTPLAGDGGKDDRESAKIAFVMKLVMSRGIAGGSDDPL